MTLGVDLEGRISLSQMNAGGKGPSKKRTVYARKKHESAAGELKVTCYERAKLHLEKW